MKNLSRSHRPLIQVYATSFLLLFTFSANATSLRLIEKKDQTVLGVSDFTSREDLEAHKAKLLAVNPDSVFEEQDMTPIEDAKKAKEEKCKNFSFKGKTIAELKQELNDERECRK